MTPPVAADSPPTTFEREVEKTFGRTPAQLVSDLKVKSVECRIGADPRPGASSKERRIEPHIPLRLEFLSVSERDHNAIATLRFDWGSLFSTNFSAPAARLIGGPNLWITGGPAIGERLPDGGLIELTQAEACSRYGWDNCYPAFVFESINDSVPLTSLMRLDPCAKDQAVGRAYFSLRIGPPGKMLRAAFHLLLETECEHEGVSYEGSGVRCKFEASLEAPSGQDG